MYKRILVLFISCLSLLMAKAPEGMILNKNYTGSSTGGGGFTYSTISNWSFFIPYNYQYSAGEPYRNGGDYPRQTAKAIYWDGFLWGGFDGANGTSNRVKVGGSIYNVGLVPGWVITGGDEDEAILADPTGPAVRVYRIRPDYASLSHAGLILDAADYYQVDLSSVTEAMTQAISDQYELDWNEWPGDRGAPYYDHDQDGVFTPYIDEPGVAQADQVIWYAMNDYNRTATQTFMECDPIGVEYQLTCWAYNMPDERLGQVVFWSHKLINTSNDTITEMYMGKWCDPDIGESGNDCIGCDPVLDMGFAYNGERTDEDYDPFDIAPPAVGYAMLQGAIVESQGDTAYIGLKPKYEYADLGMTSFVPAVVTTQSPPIVFPENQSNLKYYNLLRGYRGNEDIDNPTPWYVQNTETNPVTKFPMSGDPVAGIGDLDGTQFWQWIGDRKFIMSSGPFDFAPGDTQEVVLALVGGIGADCIGSVADMKNTARIIQSFYEDQFDDLPEDPQTPSLRCIPFENSLTLEWGSDQERVDEIEHYNKLGYTFEGYNIYQIPSGNLGKEDAVRIATFDRVNGIKVIKDTRYLDEFEGESAEVPVAYGNDTGIRRYLQVDWDHINDCPLYEGKAYYFAVTAYNQNLSDDRLGAKMYESAFIPFYVLLQEELPGNKFQSYAGQTDIQVLHTDGSGDGVIVVKIIDPSDIDSGDYRITFDASGESSGLDFSISRESGSGEQTLSSGNPVVADTLVYHGAPIVDGMEIVVMSVDPGLERVAQYNPDYTLVDESVSILNMSLGPPGYIFSNRAGACNLEPYERDFDRFNLWESHDIEIDFTDSSVAWDLNNDQCLDEKVPFAVYRRPAGTQDRERLYVAILDEGFGDETVSNGLGVWDTTGVDEIFGAPAYEPIFAYAGPSPYDPANEAAYLAANDIKAAPSSTGWGEPGNPYGYPLLTEAMIVDYSGNGYPAGYKVIFETSDPLSDADVFRFSTAGYEPISNDSLLQAAVDRINVFPNPYYGYDLITDEDFGEYVTFTHLPRNAWIRIFNIAGVLVDKLTNYDAQFVTWDLHNTSGVRVGSGMYIAHIDMPDIGREKILKFMIVRGGLY